MKRTFTIILVIILISTQMSLASIAKTNMLTCATGTITLTITLDNAPEETNWELKDASNAVYASGQIGYGNLAPGTVVTEVMPTLPDGDYALVMFDAGGNGLCCNNGSGSYELRDGNNMLIANGANFVYSEISTFCINTSNNDVFDLTPPSSVVLSLGNITNNYVDLYWTTATDNDAIFGYGVMIDGVYAGWTTYTSVTLPLLQPCTPYDFNILVRDEIGNFSVFSNTISMTSPCPPSSTVVHEGYFENGWDGWIDGGNDCARYSGTRSAEGNYSIRIRDNSGNKSSMTSPVMDLSSFNSVEFDFQYFHHGYENGEDFLLKLYENGNWTTVASFTRGTDFYSNGLYSASVTLSSSDYTFDQTNQFRIQSDASNNNDKIYIDAVVVTGFTSSSSMVAQEQEAVSWNMPLMKSFMPSTKNYVDPIKLMATEFEVYPNPTKDEFNVNGVSIEQISKIDVYDLNGELIKRFLPNEVWTLEGTNPGIKIISITLVNGEVLIKRCLKI